MKEVEIIDGRPKVVPPKIKAKTKITVECCHKQDVEICKDSIFTEIHPWYNNKNPESPLTYKGKKFINGIHRHLSIEDLVDAINQEEVAIDREEQTNILTGCYQGGTSGDFSSARANYLPFDIDIKNEASPDKNQHLYKDKALRAKLVNRLMEIAPIVFRSKSGTGIAGFLFVPGLERIRNKKVHLSIAREIINHLQSTLEKEGIIVKFDDAQNRYRQVRN